MKFLESWLREHVEIAATRDALAARLTAIGLEVEDVTELGVDRDACGLLEPPADAPVGVQPAEDLGLPDAVFELKLTPNRADCLGLRGIAFDVAAAFGGEVKPFEIASVAAVSKAQIQVRLEAGADCPRYCGRVLEDVDPAAATPPWMRERLHRSGIRPLSLPVDVTQYVMLELGHPIHAFDADALRGVVKVRRAVQGETLKLLDEREVTVDEDFLLIADDQGPLALAGVMGGWNSRVTGASRHLFLEAAHFAPAAIVGRARRLGMHTDASHRFERGVDPELPRLAIERATRLILDLAGGAPGPITEAVLPEHLPRRAPVRLRRARLARVLGLAVPDLDIARILRALGMDIEIDAEGWWVTPPSRRFDIAIEEDLIEEIARIHGYDAVPTTIPSGEIRVAAPTHTRVDEATLRRQLAARDYQEALSYAFLDAGTLARWGLDADAVALANPLTAELAVMRTALLPGLVEALRANRARQQPRVRMFEIGHVFARRPATDRPSETARLAAVACGAVAAEGWGEVVREVDFYDVKGDFESLLALMGGTAAFAFEAAGAHAPAWLHAGRGARIVRDGAAIGWIGHLHPRLSKTLDLDGETVAFEVDLDPLLARALPKTAALSRFPSVRRDLALVVPQDAPWAGLEATLRSRLGPVLREIFVFDRYQGPGVEKGFKSLAIGLILQDVSRTLTDHEVDAAMTAAVTALVDEHAARLRE